MIETVDPNATPDFTETPKKKEGGIVSKTIGFILMGFFLWVTMIVLFIIWYTSKDVGFRVADWILH